MTAPLFDVVDFNKFCSSAPYSLGLSGISVPYFQCPLCDFIFSDFLDDWSDADKRRFIYNDQYILVDPDYVEKRAIATAQEIAARLVNCEALRILDYGSGSGAFVGALKQKGFQRVVAYDPISHPTEELPQSDVVTCFEVLEHSCNPLDSLAEMRTLLADGGAIIVGQSLQPANIEEIAGRWWYIAPRNGHVSTFSKTTFLQMARKLGLAYFDGDGLYGFATPQSSDALRKILPRIGEPATLLWLTAPTAPGAGEWHDVEKLESGLSFRWSAGANLLWLRQRLQAGLNSIQTAVIADRQPGYAPKSKLKVDGRHVPITLRRGRLTAEVCLKRPATVEISLHTPPLMLDRTVGADARSLGLAFLCENSL